MNFSKVLLMSSNTIYIVVIFLCVSFAVVLKEYLTVKKLNKDITFNKFLLNYFVNLNFISTHSNDSNNNNNNNNKVSENFNLPPGPKRLPIIGNLKDLDGYEIPYQAFTDLGKKYGSIVSLKLGSIEAIAINDIQTIREVLISKAQYFDSRPNFRRYHQIFCGNKENSLAFCDWSDVQKARRDMLVQHTFPKSFSIRYSELSNVISRDIDRMIDEFKSAGSWSIPIKPIILETSAKIFINYLCSQPNLSTKTTPGFLGLIKNFDKVFYEVNQGYASDFLPFLMPLRKNHMKKLEQWSHEIRTFILENIIGDRFEKWDVNSEDTKVNDYIDSLIDHVKRDLTPKMEWNSALFALEDMIGGHAAVGNFLIKTFGYLAQNPEVQKNIQSEVDRILVEKSKTTIDLFDRNDMVYTEAVIMEALRLISSPIVPHVANQNTQLCGYDIKKDTLIFLNNYGLSMSSDYWTEPKQFEPKRFLKAGRLIKPEHFLPFGAGRRSCMGYKMVQLISFAVISSTMQHFTIKPDSRKPFKVPVGSLALPENTFELFFEPRK